MKKYQVYIFFLLSMMCASLFADGTNLVVSAFTNHHDLSLAYLAQLTGSAGGVFSSSTSGHLIATFLKVYNTAFLTICGGWLAYTTTVLVFNVSMEGNLSGQMIKTPVMLIRSVLVIVLLIPGFSGFNVAQGITVDLVAKRGVWMADKLWTHALNYIKMNNGIFWSAPNNDKAANPINNEFASGKITETINNLFGKQSAPKGFMSQILQDEVCMQKGSMDASDVNNASLFSPIFTHAVVSSDGSNITTPAKVSFPGCGSVGFSTANSAPKAGAAGINTMVADQVSAMSQLQNTASELLSVAQYVTCQDSAYQHNTACTQQTASDAGKQASLTVANAIVQFSLASAPYQSDIMAMENSAANQDTQLNTFLDNAAKDGWIEAGRMSWDLLQYNLIKQGQETGSDVPVMMPTEFSGSINNSTTASTLSGMWTSIKDKLSASSVANGNQNGSVDSDDSKYSDPTSSSWKSGSEWPFIFLPIESLLTGGIGNIVTLMSVPGFRGTSPMLFLNRLGLAMINSGTLIMFEPPVIFLAIGLAVGLCTGEYDAQDPIQKVYQWLKPYLYALGATFLGAGITLAYYAPFYPYLVFLSGVLGWLALVVESLFALPLVLVGATHPEGHDFIGPMKQALMMLINLFIRPSLMIVGMFTAMILSYIAFSFINQTFFSFVSDLFSYSPTGALNVGFGGIGTFATHVPTYLSQMAFGPANLNSAHGVASIAATTAMGVINAAGNFVSICIAFPLMMAMYASLVYTTTTQCYGLIYQLADYVGRWVGAPQSPAFSKPEELAKGVQSGSTGALAQDAKSFAPGKPTPPAAPPSSGGS